MALHGGSRTAGNYDVGNHPWWKLISMGIPGS